MLCKSITKHESQKTTEEKRVKEMYFFILFVCGYNNNYAIRVYNIVKNCIGKL